MNDRDLTSMRLTSKHSIAFCLIATVALAAGGCKCGAEGKPDEGGARAHWKYPMRTAKLMSPRSEPGSETAAQ